MGVYHRYNVELEHKDFEKRAQEVCMLMRKMASGYFASLWNLTFYAHSPDVFPQAYTILSPIIPNLRKEITRVQSSQLYTHRSNLNVDIRFLDVLEQLCSLRCRWLVTARFDLHMPHIDGTNGAFRLEYKKLLGIEQKLSLEVEISERKEKQREDNTIEWLQQYLSSPIQLVGQF
ncbi:MAG: hypothetical protein AAGJ35_08685 [Myxococcota bacterium]